MAGPAGGRRGAGGGDALLRTPPLLERLVRNWSADQRSTAADEVRDALAEGPHSLHWEGAEPPGAELRAAHRELRSPTEEAAHRSALRTLLQSESPVAVGIALDHFHLAEGSPASASTTPSTPRTCSGSLARSCGSRRPRPR
ncbi:hypothetical protein SAZ11_43400 [Streptomyces sp. FXJ1.4098]|nr:hypothetical protein [Streptomyces sp. FXJ1.4098]